MVEIDVIPLPSDPGAVVAAGAESLGLRMASDGSLRKYPGSRHWHLKKPGVSGTLEVTYWPAQSRMWVCYHSNRVGDGWVKEAAERFVSYVDSHSDNSGSV